MLTDHIKQYFTLKQDLKALSKELKDKLMEDTDYNNLSEDMRESSEVLRSYRKKLISEVPSIGSIDAKRSKVKESIKVLKASIEQSCKVVDVKTGEQLSLDFKF